MRRSFKDHIRAFCNVRQYDWTESEEDGRWVLRIDHFIKIYNDIHKKDVYVLVDNINGVRCTARASGWDVVCGVLEELMNDHLKKREHKYCLYVR